VGKIFIVDLPLKDDVKSSFLVKYIAVQTAKDGKKYLNVVLADKTGELEARSWAHADEIFSRVRKGDFVTASGKLHLYQGRKQLMLNHIEVLSAEKVDVADYEFQASADAQKMWEQLLNHVDELSEPYIRDLLLNILNENWVSERLKIWSAAKTIHHAYKSGLLEHILSCVELSRGLSKHYQVNESYVVAGAILHDLAKITEMTQTPVVDYTDEGRLVGHLVTGVEWVEKYAPQMPQDQKIHLKHILLSHHGEYEYGSPKIPQTREAMLLHLIDNLDSKMNAFESVCRTDQTPGVWSGFIKHLDRMIYKPELPSYRTENSASESPKTGIPPGNATQAPPKKNTPEPLKQNLGKLLKDFKVT
jgi:3'-5' exoribonuclease